MDPYTKEQISGSSDDKRTEGWKNVQGRIDYLTQTLANVRGANDETGKGITDAPAGVRKALANLDGELSLWNRELGLGLHYAED